MTRRRRRLLERLRITGLALGTAMTVHETWRAHAHRFEFGELTRKAILRGRPSR